MAGYKNERAKTIAMDYFRLRVEKQNETKAEVIFLVAEKHGVSEQYVYLSIKAN